jgi:hypothetical protein
MLEKSWKIIKIQKKHFLAWQKDFYFYQTQ